MLLIDFYLCFSKTLWKSALSLSSIKFSMEPLNRQAKIYYEPPFFKEPFRFILRDMHEPKKLQPNKHYLERWGWPLTVWRTHHLWLLLNGETFPIKLTNPIWNVGSKIALPIKLTSQLGAGRWIGSWSNQWKDFHIFIISSISFHGFITNQFNDLLPVGLLA